MRTGKSETELPPWSLADSWIWARLHALIREVERLFQNHQYGEAGRQIYEFFWTEFADWYVEIAKLQLGEGGDRAALTSQVLVRVLDACLRLLHPFTPFVTEELWGHLRQAAGDLRSYPGEWEQALIVARWPEARPEEGWEAQKIASFNLIQELVRSIRNLRSEKQVVYGRRIPAVLVSDSQVQLLRDQQATIAALAQLDPDQVSVIESLENKPEGHVALVAGPVEVYLPLAGLVDLAEERLRLEKDLAEAGSHVSRLETLLSGPFAQKAPPAVVQKEREKLAGFQQAAEKLRDQLAGLE